MDLDRLWAARIADLRRDLAGRLGGHVRRLLARLYQAAGAILTLFGGNQKFQLQRRRAPARCASSRTASTSTVPAVERAGAACADRRLIGRVVPIKDVKTFLRASAMLRG